MKRGLVLSLTVTAVAAAVSTLAVGVSAGPLQPADAAGPVRAQDFAQAPAPVSGHKIAAGVRAAGLDPVDAPRLRGRYYVLKAVDWHGVDMRVLADAQDGSILSILPARRSRAGRLAYNGIARIIHVPQPDDAAAEADDGGGAVREPAAPSRHIEPGLRPRSEVPRVDRHTVSSAPPPPPQRANDDTALRPIYPTPDFGPKVGNKLGDSATFDRLPPPSSRSVE